MNANIAYDSRFLRSQKAKWTLEWYKSLRYREEIGYESYSQAVIFPLKVLPGDNLMFGRGGVNDATGIYIQNSAIKDRVEGNYPIEDFAYRDDTAVYCGYLIDHWGHFLIEAVNRLWFFLKHDRPEYHYVFIVKYGEDRELKGNYKEFFELLGIDQRIEIINTPTCYLNVIVPENSFNYLEFFSREYQMIFEKVIKEALLSSSYQKEEPKRIFLSRSQFPKACNTEFGLDLLDNFFKKNKYEIIFPEKYSLKKLIVLMNNAETIAAESGSLSHNMLFCDYEQEFVIVERQTIVNRVQTSIDCVKKPRITYIDADMMIYPVIMGYGPFLMLYNSCFEKFVHEKKYIAPDSAFTDEEYIKQNLKRYLKAYHNKYYLGCGIEDNQIVFISLLFEGYYDSMKVLGKYLNGQLPFCKEQLLLGRFSKLKRIKRFFGIFKRFHK